MTIKLSGAKPQFIGTHGRPLTIKAGMALFRQETGINAPKLASVCNVSRRTAQGYFLGRTPSPGVMFKLAAHLSAHRTLNQK